MLDNATRKNLLQRSRELGYPGSIMDVYRSYEQGIDVLNDYALQQQEQQMQVAQTPQEQQIGLREEHARGNTQASMVFPDVQPNQSFNTVGMKAPINVDKYSNQGHLVESYKNVPPGIQNLPTGPYEGTVIETPAEYQDGGFEKNQSTRLNQSMNWYKDYINSPMHKTMLTNELKDDPNQSNIEAITNWRLQNLKNIKTKTHRGYNIKNPLVAGTSGDVTGNINIYRGGSPFGGIELHEISHSSDRPAYGVLTGNLAEGPNLSKDYQGQRLIPKSSQNLMQNLRFNENLTSTQIGAGGAGSVPSGDYIGEDTETRARLNVLRMLSQKQNIYDPLNKPINKEQFKNLLNLGNEDNPLRAPLKDLQKIYSDEEIFKMLNTISKGVPGETPKDIRFAKHGGLRTPTKYQPGGFQYPVVTAQSLNMKEGSGKKVSPFSKNMVFKNTPASTEALDWYKQYVQSPMHYEMLSKEDPKNVDWIAKQRLKNVQNIKMRTHTMPFSKDPLVGGTSLGLTGNINIYPSGLNSGTEIHEVSHSSDRPVGFPYIGTGGGASYFGKRLIPKSSVQLSKPNPLAPQSEIDKGIAEAQYNKDKGRQFQLQDWKDYVTKPTEVRARLNTIRMMAQQQNIYDPFTEKISEEQYQNLLKYKPNFENPTMEPLNQLRDIYNDEQIIHMLNTFSKSEQQPTLLQNTQFAQTGGLRNHMMNYMNTTGRDTTHVNLVMDAIGQHESKNIVDRKQDSYKTVDGKRVRYDGPGRGIFQFETGPKEGGNTAINRTANFLKYNTDKSIHDFPNLNKIYNKSNSLDFSTLSKKDQEALFIGDKIFGGEIRRNEFDAITRNRETPPTQEEVFMYWLRNHKGSIGGKPVVIETKDSKGTVIKRELNPNLTKEEIKEEKRRWNNRTKKIFKKNPLYTVKENPVPLKVRIPFKLKKGGYYKKCM